MRPPKPPREKPRPVAPPLAAPSPLPPAPVKIPYEPAIPIDDVLAHLRKGPAHRPKRRGTLGALLKNHFHVSDDAVAALIDELVALGRVTIDPKHKVSYQL